MFSKGIDSVSLEDILNKVSEIDILYYYLSINKVPCVINSPLRKDERPSFGIYSPNGSKICYIDYSTKDKGGLFDLLGLLWGCNYKETLLRINKDIPKFNINFSTIKPINYRVKSINNYNESTDLQCKVRDWEEYDIEYWESYGINIKWLKYAEVYPISHKIVIKDNKKYVFKADKYAYAYIEHKEGNVTLKIYQPFNTEGYKWANKHDKSVVSLWTKVPEYGDKICICSSLKDALCLWSNLGIPSISIQGEGYTMSNTAINELRRRYKDIYILLDNDETGIKDGISLANSTGFINLVLPEFKGGKDISDAFKVLGKEKWVELIKPLFY